MPSPWDYTHTPGNNGVTLNQSRWGLLPRLVGTGGGLSANFLYATPFGCGGNLTLPSLRVFLGSGGSNGNARLGVYRNTSASVLYPSTLVDQFEFSFLSTDTGYAGGTFTTPLTLNDGLFWFVMNLSAGKVMNSVGFSLSNNFSPLHLLGIPSSFFGANVIYGLGRAQTYAALPATFPAGATAVNAPPMFYFRG